VTGETFSKDFPIINALFPEQTGNILYSDAFVAKISPQASSSKLEYFSFSTIPSLQSVGVPFEVTISAKDNVGNILTDFNDTLSLSSSVPISPISVNLSAGVWTGEIRLCGGGNNLRITASAFGVSSSSNRFNTTIVNSGNVSGTIFDNRKNSLSGAEVYISDTPSGPSIYPPDISDENGEFSFEDIPEGPYYIWSIYADISSERSSWVIPGNMTTTFNPGAIPMYRSMKTPVVLVPGMIGSTHRGKSGWVTPRLNEEYAALSDLKLFEWRHYPGWQLLKNYLTVVKGLDELTTIIDCPWDWRRTSWNWEELRRNPDAVKRLLKDVYQDYLIKAIDRAKNGNPNQKVNIIAHSMGGLLVREYIQSDEYSIRNDIENFTMVGTPNMGSANAYYIWEGGDPLKVDNITSSGPFNINFNTIEALYEETYKKGDLPHYGIRSHAEIRKLLKDKSPSLRQLLPTYRFLKEDNGSLKDILTADNINDYLIALNSDTRRFERMGDPLSSGKVKTRIYYSNTENTIYDIDVKPTFHTNPFPFDFYLDGKPKRDPILHTMGDGTVLSNSARLPCDDIEPWAECIDAGGSSHKTLIKDYYQDIADALYEDDVQVPAQTESRIPISQIDVTEKLIISYDGRVQPYLTDPLGRTIGINPNNGSVDRAIPSTEINIGGRSGLLSINDPVDGDYNLSIKILYDENYQVSIAYASDDIEYSIDFRKFGNPGVFSLSFNLNPANQTPVSLTHHPDPPTNLVANAVYQGDELKTNLSWDSSSSTDVTEYKIYARHLTEPFLTQIGSTPAQSFDTGDSWPSDPTIKVRAYAVSAVSSSDSESFLSAMVTNDDLDHDGLDDENEIILGTFVDNPDSDEDYYSDGEEIWLGTDPLDPQSKPCRGDCEPDGDVDGADLAAYIANNAGISLADFAIELGRTDCPK
jgi:hypothetical protein